jgi:hypothetical protein
MLWIDAGGQSAPATSTVKLVTAVPAAFTLNVTVPLGVPEKVPVYVRPATCEASTTPANASSPRTTKEPTVPARSLPNSRVPSPYSISRHTGVLGGRG